MDPRKSLNNDTKISSNIRLDDCHYIEISLTPLCLVQHPCFLHILCYLNFNLNHSKSKQKKQASPHMSQAHMWSSFDKSWMSAMASQCLEYLAGDFLLYPKKHPGEVRYWRCDPVQQPKVYTYPYSLGCPPSQHWWKMKVYKNPLPKMPISWG